MPFSISYYRTHSPDFKGLKLEIIIFFICSFIFPGSRSGTINPDPDPGLSSGSIRIRIHNAGWIHIFIAGITA